MSNDNHLYFPDQAEQDLKNSKLMADMKRVTILEKELENCRLALIYWPASDMFYEKAQKTAERIAKILALKEEL